MRRGGTQGSVILKSSMNARLAGANTSVLSSPGTALKGRHRNITPSTLKGAPANGVKKKTKGEIAFYAQLRSAGVRGFEYDTPILCTHQNHPKRRFRYDYIDIARRIVVEIDGGTWAMGRHTRGAGYANDCHKQAYAIHHGYRTLRGTTEQAEDGTLLGWLLAIL